MSLYLFGYEIPIDGCRYCIDWTPDRHGKTWWRLNGPAPECAHCRWEGWWIIDDVEYYLGRDPNERHAR